MKYFTVDAFSNVYHKYTQQEKRRYDVADDDMTDHTDESGAKNDPMTDAQKIYLDTLSDQTGEPSADEHLSKDEAALKIEELRQEAGYDTSTDDQDEP